VLDAEVGGGSGEALVRGEEHQVIGVCNGKVQSIDSTQRRGEAADPFAGQRVFLCFHGQDAVAATFQVPLKLGEKAARSLHVEFARPYLDGQCGADLDLGQRADGGRVALMNQLLGLCAKRFGAVVGNEKTRVDVGSQ
jgi:hypothetical protein